MLKIQNVKGGYDFLPNEQKIRNYINNVLKETFETFGFKSIETPILCYYDMLSNKYEEESDILKEIYKLKDQGNRQLGLRYDLTVPFAKFIALNKNNISFPFKRYEISKVFRDGPVKVGRDREFTQCDVDVVGIDGQFIEAELISLFITAFKKLNIDIVIKYNSRKLMNGLILASGISKENLSVVTVLMDKKDKLSDDEFIKMLKDAGLSDIEVNMLNKYFSLSTSELLELFENTEFLDIKEGLKELKELEKYLSEMNINACCQYCSTLARGQNYYTGNVFEVYEKDLKVTGSIAAGGRYDNMITDFINDGNKYPTVGISFGLSSIYELLKNKNIAPSTDTQIYIIPLDTDIECLKLANYLRNMGFITEVEMQKRKIKKSLNFASREKIPYVIILGEDELKRNEIIIKNMLTSENFTVNLSNLEKIKKITT